MTNLRDKQNRLSARLISRLTAATIKEKKRKKEKPKGLDSIKDQRSGGNHQLPRVKIAVEKAKTSMPSALFPTWALFMYIFRTYLPKRVTLQELWGIKNGREIRTKQTRIQQKQ